MESVPGIPDIDRRGLRHFGLTTGGIVIALFGLFFPWLLDARLPWWPFVLGGTLAGWGLGHPGSLRPVYRAWMRLGLLLNRVTSPVILGVLFYLVFTPFALVMKALGRDPMHRRFEPEAASYRRRAEARPPRSMENPF